MATLQPGFLLSTDHRSLTPPHPHKDFISVTPPYPHKHTTSSTNQLTGLMGMCLPFVASQFLLASCVLTTLYIQMLNPFLLLILPSSSPFPPPHPSLLLILSTQMMTKMMMRIYFGLKQQMWLPEACGWTPHPLNPHLPNPHPPNPCPPNSHPPNSHPHQTPLETVMLKLSLISFFQMVT